jgi:hypothetical protein
VLEKKNWKASSDFRVFKTLNLLLKECSSQILTCCSHIISVCPGHFI